MTRSTIDFGIDLGTTNSEIAVFNGTTTDVIRDNENFENTPSAVWIDARGRKFVGRQAKEKFAEDADNAKVEFKRQMGNAETIVFKDSGKSMLPEQLSAEVLSQLKANVKQWLNEDITAAVITVPADFTAAQIAATNRAARQAGLEISPLLQEPVAAATAYHFQNSEDTEKARWLVYDFGGGTFDAALIRRRDGMIHVENHGGDKYLGGKDLDAAIISSLLVPALLKQAKLQDFTPNNPRWRGAFAKLKKEAESAKIRLSRTTSELIDIRGLCKDETGRDIDFEYELQRSELESLADPLIVKSINICKEVLTQARLGPGDIEKLILVGGPTLMPHIRERLADKSEGLGIPLEFRVDPFTVVARGAAIFAATQPYMQAVPLRAGEYQIELEYQAIGPDENPPLSGQVISEKSEIFRGFSIEFINRGASPPWRSGKIGLSPEGKFMATLWAEKGSQNTFAIELTDPKGTLQLTMPSSFPYTVGGGIGPQILIHDIGVGLVDNSVITFFEKGEPLKARRRINLATAVDCRKGSTTDAIKVPVVEGEENRADRNDIVGSLVINGSELTRDLPAGSEIEVLIEIDESRRFKAKVFVPLLDEEFETEFIKTHQRASVDTLEADVQNEKRRLDQLRDKVARSSERRARELLQRVDSERLEADVDASLVAARGDQDAGDKCASRLHDLQVVLDEIEETLKWPEQVSEAEGRIEFATSIVQRHGSTEDKQHLQSLVREVRQAIAQSDAGLLQGRRDALASFAFSIWRETDEYLINALRWMEEDKALMRDQTEAARLLSDGVRAMNAGDSLGMRRALAGLRELLPVERQTRENEDSTVQRVLH